MSDEDQAPAAEDIIVVWATRPRNADEWWYPFITAVEAACVAAASGFANRWSGGPPAGQPSVCLAFTVPDSVREGLRDELGRIAADFGGAPLTWVDGTPGMITAGPEAAPVP